MSPETNNNTSTTLARGSSAEWECPLAPGAGYPSTIVNNLFLNLRSLNCIKVLLTRGCKELQLITGTPSSAPTMLRLIPFLKLTGDMCTIEKDSWVVRASSISKFNARAVDKLVVHK